MKIKESKTFWEFILFERWKVLIAILVFIGVAFFVGWSNYEPFKANEPNPNIESLWIKLNWWAKWADPVFGLGVFITTLFIGVNELLEDWKESLVKRLTVRFQYKERDIFVCENAFLSDEGDIRDLGQQIGRQMNFNRFLAFEPYNIVSQQLGRMRDELNNPYIKYEIIFQLSDLPNDDKLSTEQKEDLNKLSTHTLYWITADNPSQFKEIVWK